MRRAPGVNGLSNDLQPVDRQVEKVAYSAFYMTRLEWLLRKSGIEALIVGGIVTNGGVASTVRDAHARDIAVTVLEDGCAAFGGAMHWRCNRRLAPGCAHCDNRRGRR